MKKTLLFSLLAVFCISVKAADFPFAGGNGTQASPYEIETAVQLDAVRNYMTSHFILKKDIDLNLSEDNFWKPIGKTADSGNAFTAFNGSFDGDGHVISGIYVKYTGNYVGLFAVVGGTIKNLGVKGTVVNPAGGSTGLLAGYLGQANQTMTVENCFAEGTVIAENSGTAGGAGLLIGTLANAGDIVRNCYTKGSVSNTAGYYTGGITGRTSGNGATLTNCYSEATVTGQAYVGGIIGQTHGSNVSNCYATGTVSGDTYVGGVVGNVFSTSMNLSGFVAANTSVNATTNAVAALPTGLVGRVAGNVAGSIVDAYGLESVVVKIGEDLQTITNSTTGKDGAEATLIELQSQDFYEAINWDFTDVWAMPAVAGFPIFKTENGDATEINKTSENSLTAFCSNSILHIDGLKPQSNVCVYNLTGQLIAQKQNVGSLTIDLPAKGIYIIELLHEGQREITKIINK